MSSTCKTPALPVEDFPTCWPVEKLGMSNLQFTYDENTEHFTITLDNDRQQLTFKVDKAKAVFIAENILSLAKQPEND